MTVATRDAVYICPVFRAAGAEDSGAYRLEVEGDSGLIGYINRAAAGSLYQTDFDLECAAGVLTLSNLYRPAQPAADCASAFAACAINVSVIRPK